MRIAYLDCFAGISGDMFLGALLDAGVPFPVLEQAVAALDLGATLEVERVDRSGISSAKVHVLEGRVLAEAAPGQPHEHTHLHAHASHEHTHGSASEPEPAAASHTHTHTHTHEHTTDTHEHTHEHDHGEVHAHTHAHTHGAHEHSHSHEHAHSHSHEQAHSHGRSLTQIRALLAESSLAPGIKAFATRAFELLGASEAKIHNIPVDAIHFHEVGAVDAIADIVAASAGIDYLARGEEALSWYCSPINVGGGMVECAHGTFPVPAPATADLLRGMPTYSAHVEKELVTPTGAAILRALAPEFGPQPPARISSIGYGAGTRNPKGFPNVLRLSLGESAALGGTERLPDRHAHDDAARHGETVAVFETAIDDATPQVLAHVAERALAAGALDVMLTPVVMKKGRAATLLTVLAHPADSAAMERLLLRETTTLGIRIHHQQRACLDRVHTTVTTAYGAIRVKVGSLQGEELNATPEFEDCRAAAAKSGVPLKQVLQAAVAAYAIARAEASAPVQPR